MQRKNQTHIQIETRFSKFLLNNKLKLYSYIFISRGAVFRNIWKKD